MDLTELLPGMSVLTLQEMEIDPEEAQIRLQVKSTQESRCCPVCGQASQRFHSHYTRTLADLPWSQYTVIIRLEVGKWFCQNPDCKQKIFTERLPEVVAPWARRTRRLADAQSEIGLALGGKAGAQLSEVLKSGTSRETLLRLIRRQPLNEVSTPRVLGIDDWAKRKGQTYGTILVDLETHQVIDVLPERSAASIEQWLKMHPGVEVISRDRAGEYAAGATAGAPDATQVADRWHLLKNLGDALTQALKKYTKELRAIPTGAELLPATTVGAGAGLGDELSIERAAPSSSPSPRQHISQQKRADRLARYEQVRTWHEQGWTQKAIAAQLNLSAKTVSRWLATDTFPEYQSRHKGPRLIDPYKPYLLERWTAGCRNGAQLLREIRTQGYSGGATIVADLIAQLRREQGLPPRSHALDTAGPVRDPQPPVLTPRQLTAMIFKPIEERTEEHGRLIDRVHEKLPHLQPVLQLVEEFALLVRQRLSSTLNDWLDRASRVASLRSFVQGVRRDNAAVYARMVQKLIYARNPPCMVEKLNPGEKMGQAAWR